MFVIGLSPVVLFVLVEVLRSIQKVLSHAGTFLWLEPVLGNEDDVSCSRTQQRALGRIRTRDLAIKSPGLY